MCQALVINNHKLYTTVHSLGFRPVALCIGREKEERRMRRRRKRSFTSDYSYLCSLVRVITLCWTLWNSLYSNDKV